MDNPQGGFGGKAVELGELPIKHAADHGKNSVQQCQIHTSFYVHFSFVLHFIIFPCRVRLNFYDSTPVLDAGTTGSIVDQKKFCYNGPDIA